MKKEKCIMSKETVQKFYKIENNRCPVCDKEFIYVTNIVKYKGKGYHESCFFEIKNL